ncbi:MAG TPA: gephyrin-like molybdotransferase Glp [Xanthobacteraceae bacterium]|nr:gephyrin-like molybdotransferase Glp [Xanthobacteraceae bacterium]
MTPLISLEEALARVLESAARLGSETVPLDEAHGRVLAAQVVARRSAPSADVSAMDGYAVRAADVAVAPTTLDLIGTAPAGHQFAGTLRPGTAVRIFTGGVLPDGADAVVIQEDTVREGARVTIREAAVAERHIRRAGADFRAGAIVLPAGRRIGARDVALIAAADHGTVEVARRPRVGLIATGDELVAPGQGAGPHQVVASNVYSVAALVRGAGGEPRDLGLVPDRLDLTEAAVRAALASDLDVLVTLGGASVGDHDLVAPALAAQGVHLGVHKVALRPGKPLMFGRSGTVRVLGLPGNPVSTYVCALLFLVPLLRALQGEAGVPALPLQPAELDAELRANDQRMDFMRAEIVGQGAHGPKVRPLPVQDSAFLSVLARADALLVRRPHAPAGRAGEPCEIVRLTD